MKKQVLFIAVIATLAFNCSTEEAPKLNDQNISLEKQSSLVLNISKLIESKEFKSYVQNDGVQQKSAQGNGHNTGLMILHDGYDLAVSLLDFSTFDITFIGGIGKIEELPNGKAKFSIHTTNPSAGVFNLFSDEGRWGSDCVEGKKGIFNFSFISEYIVDRFEPVPGLVFISYIPTGENSSAEVSNGHCKISDAVPTYNESQTELLECGETTMYKTVKARTVYTANGENKTFTLTVN